MARSERGKLHRVSANFDESARWLTVERGSIKIAVNLDTRPQLVPLAGDSYQILLASEQGLKPVPNGINLPPDAVAILKRVN